MVNIAAGWYTLTLTDANLCQTSNQIYVAEPLPLTVTLSTSPESGSILPAINGGTLLISSAGRMAVPTPPAETFRRGPMA
ncbi:MAG: hypothetical protein H6555_00775 [Lewinellaceae bacterium]|nr:hypothetical protein [Lewinellaceae bacterium]